MGKVAWLLLLMCWASIAGAKERKWLDAEVASIKESDVETLEQLYKSPTVNNQPNGPLRDAGVEQRKSKLYTYDFQTADKHFLASVPKKPVEGLAEHAKVKIVVERGWLVVLLPDKKEKRLDFLESKSRL